MSDFSDSPGERKDPVNDRFLRACRREPVDATPVWLMRQAGRYMPEYRALRKRHSLLELCRTPELAVEVTLQPIHAFGFDAAILFSDLLIPLDPLGLPFDFHSGEGPVVEKPIRSRADVEALRPFEPREKLGMVLEAIRLLRGELSVPLIGFAGAPFTLASYAIEGGKSSNFAKTKELMYSQPETWHRLAGLLADVVTDYLGAQVEAGVQAVQVFDSWIGALDESDYREFVFPTSSGSSTGSRHWTSPRSTSAPAPVTCWRSSARPEALSSAWTGERHWMKDGSGRARTSRSRATSTRPCSSGRGSVSWNGWMWC